MAYICSILRPGGGKGGQGSEKVYIHHEGSSFCKLRSLKWRNFLGESLKALSYGGNPLLVKKKQAPTHTLEAQPLLHSLKIHSLGLPHHLPHSIELKLLPQLVKGSSLSPHKLTNQPSLSPSSISWPRMCPSSCLCSPCLAQPSLQAQPINCGLWWPHILAMEMSSQATLFQSNLNQLVANAIVLQTLPSYAHFAQIIHPYHLCYSILEHKLLYFYLLLQVSMEP